jgi:hypothetical protein
VSVVIPGQPGSFVPTWTDSTTGPRGAATDKRVRSFTRETPQQGSADYTFGPLRAGTYLVESGTHPAVQVQMGLYGSLTVLPTIAGRAYDEPSTVFDTESTFLFSEIDPALHAAVAAGVFGAAPATPSTPPDAPDAVLPAGWMTSTIDFHPKYFLINGKPFRAGDGPSVLCSTNHRILMRFLNAGLETHVPVLQGQQLSVIAEDAHVYSVRGFSGSPPTAGTCAAPRAQYSVFLPAGKTTDAVFVSPPTPLASLPLYDRRLNLSNNGKSPGGMMVLLSTSSVGGGATPPPPPPACTLVGR